MKQGRGNWTAVLQVISIGFPLDLVQEREEHRDHFIGRLLLYPMSRTFDQHDIVALHPQWCFIFSRAPGTWYTPQSRAPETNAAGTRTLRPESALNSSTRSAGGGDNAAR